jgi:hypothetical protein
MSPAKQAKRVTSRKLTIEFSGICTLVWNQKAGTASVKLVDLASAGFDRHYAALGLQVTENMTPSVRGPDADAAISLPGSNTDMGVWNLLGTDVEIVGATGNLTVDDSKVDVTKKPGKTAQSIQWLANVAFLTDSKQLDPVCPTAAVIQLPAGHLTASAAGNPRKVEFIDQGTAVGLERFCLSRFKATIPFDLELALRLDRRRVLRFTDTTSLIISNTCVCGLGVGIPPNHFYAHYDVVRARRRPTMKLAGPQPKIPSYPEFCWPALLGN